MLIRPTLKLTYLLAIAFFSLAAATSQDGLILKRLAKVGDVAKFRMKGEMTYQGSPVIMSGLITEKITKVTADGQYTVASSTSENKVSFAGNEVPTQPGETGLVETTFKSTGEVVSVISEVNDPNVYRMANLQSIRFPLTPVKVGSTWEVNIPKDDKGSVDAKGTFKVEAREKVGAFDTLRVHGTLKELIARNPASVDATYWVDVNNGTVVKLSGTWTNAPFPPPLDTATAKITITRES
jgi:hypothetical protein